MSLRWVVFAALVAAVTAAPGATEKRAIFAPKCMDDLGCFDITSDFFHAIYRPINLSPADREKINTKFVLFTRNHPKTPFTIRAKNKDLLDKSGFDVKRKTKLIVHGWIDNQLFGDWMFKMKNEYLLNGDHNVIIVDWSGGNSLPYTQATANTRVVGAEIAFLLQWLKDTEGLKLEDCHILGHSLGSHVAGYAGERLKKLGRITGMDPADPYFQYMPPSVRLDPTDADFVDIIHTDSRSILLGGLGMSQLVGHVDFFPNAGYKQPGCAKDRLMDFFTEGLAGGMRSFIACNHQRAVDFAIDSINQHQCVFTGHACPDWQTFLDGKCASCGAKGDRCAQMGDKAPEHFYRFRNDTIQQSFYLVTGPSSPFCLYQYQISLSLDRKGSDVPEGYLYLTLQGKKAITKLKLNNGSKIRMHHGATYNFLVTTDSEPGDIFAVTFSWEAAFKLMFWVKTTVHLQEVKVVPMNVVEASAREALTRKYCASKEGPISPKTAVTFLPDDRC